MVFKRKTPKPEEMRLKAGVMAKQLQKKELAQQRKTEEARALAKTALRKGDDRAYNRAARRFQMTNQQLEMLMTQSDMAATMVDALEAQEGMQELVQFGDELSDLQSAMGLDVTKMKQSMQRMQMGMERVNKISDAFMTTVESSLVDPSKSEISEQLRAELMAELETETGYETEVATTIRRDAGMEQEKEQIA